MCNGGLCITIHPEEKQQTLTINNRDSGRCVDARLFLREAKELRGHSPDARAHEGHSAQCGLTGPSGATGINPAASRALSAQECCTAGIEQDANRVRGSLVFMNEF